MFCRNRSRRLSSRRRRMRSLVGVVRGREGKKNARRESDSRTQATGTGMTVAPVTVEAGARRGTEAGSSRW